MATYVARIDREGKTMLERADVTGRAAVDQVHPALSKKGPRLVEVAGTGAVG